MRRPRRTASAVALLLLVAASAGCGGGSSTGEAETAEDPFAEYPEGPTRQFIDPGGDNVVQEYGREATPAERAQVSKMVEAWLRARAKGDWGEVCKYTHEKEVAYILRLGAQVAKEPISSCARALSFAITQLTEAPRDNIKGGVASLRVANGHGYAQYHGKEGLDWVLAVRRENGTWKVSDLRPIERYK